MKKICVFLTVLFAVVSLSAENGGRIVYSAVGLLPVKYLELPGPDADVRIMRLNLIAGCHKSMYGLDLAVLGGWTRGDSAGILLSGGYNVCLGECYGLQLASVNFTEGAHCGLQIGAVNMTWGLRGMQIGAVNATSDGAGWQIGLYNMAESFSGIQLGLINMNIGSPLMMMPLLNVWF